MLGIFDSGLGGLTIAAEISRRMPGLSFTYRADHARAPYGARTPAEILALATAQLDAMFRHGCSLVIFACNTASASALRDIQQNWLPRHWPGRNALGVVVPVVEALAEHLPDVHASLPAAQAVHIFATGHTVRSQVFVTEIYKRAPGVRVLQTACPDLAPAIERGAGVDERRGLVEHYAALAMQQCRRPDYIILGCTHYALIRHKFEAALPGIPILDQPATLAEKLEDYLSRHPEYAMQWDGQRTFQTTGDAPAVNRTARPYFKRLGLTGEFAAARHPTRAA